jgi:hypothetical protein
MIKSPKSIAIALLLNAAACVPVSQKVEKPTVISHQVFVSKIRKGAKIQLPAGSIVQLNAEVYLPTGVTITTDPNNPATIVRSEESYGLCVQGASITIENVVLDFAMRGVWREYQTMISFKFPQHRDREPDAPIRDVTIRNVTFIDSSPPKERNTKDSWAINLAHNSPESLRNIKILHCKQMAPRIQLTGNGQGTGGIDGLEILHNFVSHGHANSIAVSSNTDDAAFQNFLIAHNELRHCTSIGVFVGLDGGKGNKKINLKNVVIADNHIELAPDSGDFPHCIFIRASSRCEGLMIARNVCNTANAKGKARWLGVQGSRTSPGEFALKDNVCFGQCSKVVSNMIETK